MNICSYIRRFNVLMSFENDNAESIIKEDAEVFNNKSNTNMLFGAKFEERVAKSLSSKDKI